MPRYFTLPQAEHALQRLVPELNLALALRAEMRQAEEELQAVTRKVIMTGGLAVDRDKVAATKRLREQTVERLQGVIESVQNTGCLVKDVDVGLLDFPTLYRGTEVYLCWKAGEQSIAFWHGIEEGFRGRKPIDEDFLANHRGGQE